MRRKLKLKTPIKPDITYQSPKVAKFINYVMLDGKKSVARDIVYGALEEIKKAEKKEPVIVFEAALENVAPMMEVRSRRIGGANYQVPREVRPDRRLFLAMNWLIEAARKRSGKSMSQLLAEEILAASKNEGEAAKKKENMHKMAEANKAFAHFAW